jgi:hypothetical protein
MGQSSLLGTSKAPTEAKGRDTRALGPSDNSDGGSDTVGVAPGTDPFVPVDVALADDSQHPLESRGGARPGADSDTAALTAKAEDGRWPSLATRRGYVALDDLSERARENPFCTRHGRSRTSLRRGCLGCWRNASLGLTTRARPSPAGSCGRVV